MIPRIIHTIWLGGDMPDKIEECVHSIGVHHPDWTRVIWDEHMLHAAFCENPDELKATIGSWASVTNYLRLNLLYKFGGIYLDADVEALRPIDNLLEIRGAFAAEQDGGRICNAVMGAPRHDPWIGWQIEHWDDFNQKDAASGVYLATEAPRDQVTLIPSHWVYPYLYSDPPEKRKPHPESLLCHLWLGSWT